MPVGWLRRHKWIVGAAILATSVLMGIGIWFLLVSYIEPNDPTGRKDVVQVFALIVAGIVGIIGAAVGLSNVRIARRNLEHNQEALRSQLNSQRELEDKRTQDAGLQSYFEHMGSLLTDHNLIGTDREDIRLLARAQTLTVLARLNGPSKGNLVRFLHGAGLIDTSQDKPILELAGADLSGADLSGTDLRKASFRNANLNCANFSDSDLGLADLTYTDLSGANLQNSNLISARLSDSDLSHADLSDADMHSAHMVNADLSNACLVNTRLRGANLSGAGLSKASLHNADLSNARLRNATVDKKELAVCKSLEGATMPDGQKTKK